MANSLSYKAQLLTINGVGCGGMTDVTVNLGFRNVTRPSIDDLKGPGPADRTVVKCDGSFTSEDIGHSNAKGRLIQIMETSPTSAGLQFHTAEAGLATYTLHTVGDDADVDVLVHSGAVDFRLGQVGRMSAQFACNFDNAAKTFSDVKTQTENVVAGSLPSRTAAERSAEVDALVFDSATQNIAIANPTGFGYSIAGQLVRSGVGDHLGEIVDVVGYIVTGYVTFKSRGSSTSLVEDLLTATQNLILTATVKEHATSSQTTIAIKNVTWEPESVTSYPAAGSHVEWRVPFSVAFDATNDTLGELIAYS